MVLPTLRYPFRVTDLAPLHTERASRALPIIKTLRIIAVQHTGECFLSSKSWPTGHPHGSESWISCSSRSSCLSITKHIFSTKTYPWTCASHASLRKRLPSHMSRNSIRRFPCRCLAYVQLKRRRERRINEDPGNPLATSSFWVILARYFLTSRSMREMTSA